MSAVVCGKRSPSVFFLEEQQSSSLLHHPQAKKFRRCSSLSPPFVHTTTTIGATSLDQLRSIFPIMDPQLLERVLEESGNDIDLAIRSLNDLHLESAEGNIACIATASETEIKTSVQLLADVDAYCATNAHSEIPGVMGKDGKGEAASTNCAHMDGLPRNGSEWVEVLVREMMGASDVEDAKARTSRVLDVLEKSIIANASRSEAMQIFHKENMLLKEQLETMSRENNVLKRAVAIQHDRQKEYEGKSQELQHLRQLVSQYKEQLAKLEVSNYALSMHLRQAQQSNSIPGRFKPDVF